MFSFGNQITSFMENVPEMGVCTTMLAEKAKQQLAPSQWEMAPRNVLAQPHVSSNPFLDLLRPANGSEVLHYCPCTGRVR